MVPRKRVLLRLDDGSIIAAASSLGVDGQGVVRVNIDRAAELGRATEKDAQRVQTLLDRLKAQYGVVVPQAPPVGGQFSRLAWDPGFSELNLD